MFLRNFFFIFLIIFFFGKSVSGKEYIFKWFNNVKVLDSLEFFEVLLDEITKELPNSNIAANVLFREFKGKIKIERRFIGSLNGICSRC